MRLYVNGEERTMTGSGSDTLQGILTRIQEEALAAGETILDVQVDGRALQRVTTPLGNLRVEDIGALEVAVASVRRLAGDGLSDAVAYLPRLSQGLVEAAVALQRGAVAEGADLLIQALEGLGWVHQLFANLSRLAEQDKAPWITAGDADKLGRWADGLEQRLDRCRQALEEQDYVLVADRLEYDLAAWLALLPVELERLREQVKAGM